MRRKDHGMESDRYDYHHHGFCDSIRRFCILVMGLAHSQTEGDTRTMNGQLLKCDSVPRPKFTRLPPWTEAETAYIAGLIDGEGSVGLYSTHRRREVFVMLTVTNTHRLTMEWLSRMMGMSPLIRRFDKRQSRRRDYYYVAPRGKRVHAVLIRIFPYLRIKSAQAKLCIDFREWRDARGGRLGYYSVLEWQKIGEWL